MTKEEILKQKCDRPDNMSDDTYLDLEGNVIDGKAQDVLDAMEKYAQQQCELQKNKCNRMKKTIIVLDNYTMKVHVYQNAVNDDKDADKFIAEIEHPKHRLSECSWMVVDKLELIIETK